jgi:tetratricopeptide (TPR) repeat protein
MSVKTRPAPQSQVESLFMQSSQLLQQGNAAAAKKGLMKVVKKLPKSAVAWYNLGLSHQYLNEHQKAVSAYRKTVDIKADFVDGWINLGLAYKELGSQEQAEKAVKVALSKDPNHPRALNLMGTLEAAYRRPIQAQEYFRRALEAVPDFDDARYNLANAYSETGDNALAMEMLKPLLERDPHGKRNRILQAQILLNMDRMEESSHVVLELEKQFQDDPDVWQLGITYREEIRDHFGVIELAQKLLKLRPNDANVWNSLGSAYFQLDGIAKAKSCYEKAIELDPTHAQYENNLGLTCSSTGDKVSAESHYRRALDLNPEFAEAYRNIVAMKRFSSLDDDDVVAMRKIWETPDLDEFNKTKLAFALGKVYDDLGLYDQAFDAYRIGNDLKYKDTKMDLDKYFSHMERFPAVFDNPPINVAHTETGIKPIFILGMPRSGTTLVEQIISRHPDVFGCGELPCIERSITRLEKKSDPQRVYPNDFWTITHEVFETEAGEYEAWVRKLHDIDTHYITDKMPFNFVHVWLIKAMFPHAPIIHCRRHPLDVITSNYFQLYGTDISFTYNLEALARYYVRYYRLMEHWNRIFDDVITTIQYEILVQDADVQTRRLIEAAGLPWDDACLDQKKSDTAVRTASIWQVRQGIYTSSRERWRHYEKQLKPAIDILMAENILGQSLQYLSD